MMLPCVCNWLKLTTNILFRKYVSSIACWAILFGEDVVQLRKLNKNLFPITSTDRLFACFHYMKNRASLVEKENYNTSMLFTNFKHQVTYLTFKSSTIRKKARTLLVVTGTPRRLCKLINVVAKWRNSNAKNIPCDEIIKLAKNNDENHNKHHYIIKGLRFHFFSTKLK